jgi:Phage integrase family
VDGPIFLTPDGQRLDRHGAAGIVRRIARRAGITKPVGPRTLHAFITAALDAGASLRDVQEAASHADPRTAVHAGMGDRFITEFMPDANVWSHHDLHDILDLCSYDRGVFSDADAGRSSAARHVNTAVLLGLEEARRDA